jgi:response regulator NasT
VLLLVGAQYFEEMSAHVEDAGVITLSKPLHKELFWNALKLARAAYIKMQNLQSENTKLVRRIEDIRIVDRAKCMLISYLNMTEAQAHKYIEKQAMDTRMTKRAVAEDILKTYEY